MIKIHKEGRTILLVFLLILLMVNLAIAIYSSNEVAKSLTTTASILFFIFVSLFFRNPNRDFVHHEQKLISPADGRVVVIEEVFEPEYFKDKRLQVSIFMSISSVHVNRWPINGLVRYYRHHSGRFYAAFLPKASTENERATIVLEFEPGREVMIRQIAGAMARRIVTYAKEGEIAVQNKDMGFIKFGSRVDLILPVGTPLDVAVGDRVKGGISQITKF
ncbi:phosphatidylserine decarboxylase family protein [Saccharicrinis sp. FJH2]|uniref:phosphatidylserine decarboxylase family protein n=1 Tax=unclassified Saccharicrinis TaxID=2646859 RepID=UPI0035D46411